MAKKETIYVAKIESPYTLVQECENAFGIGAQSNVRIYDRTGQMVTRANFQIETLTDGSEVFNVILK